MPTFPTLEQLTEALQNPSTSLIDSTLKSGSIAKNGYGLPTALCGGFALTYKIFLPASKETFALRCFHKHSPNLTARYKELSRCIQSLQSPYFLDFEFQQNGIRIGGCNYPIVKMRWAEGQTLGEFVDLNHASREHLQELLLSLGKLCRHLHTKGIAHGDIQPGNIIVSDRGKKIHLIDYDGMYIDSLKAQGSSELGQRNFQHPKRSTDTWNSSLDRFSFIVLWLSITILIHNPDYWKQTLSDGDSFLFRASDFAYPERSTLFSALKREPALSLHAGHFESVCQADIASVPSLADFVSGKNIPAPCQPAPAVPGHHTRAPYLSAFPVLDASVFESCLAKVGDRVEFVGRVVSVKVGKTFKGDPYVFLNFGDWRAKCVKAIIWQDGLSQFSRRPDSTWIGRWISVTGLVDSPYRSTKYAYEHLSITIKGTGQLRVLGEAEARHRLASVGMMHSIGNSGASVSQPSSSGRGSRSPKSTVSGLPASSTQPGASSKGTKASTGSKTVSNSSGAGLAKSSNQKVIEEMKKAATRPSSANSTGANRPVQRVKASPTYSSSSSGRHVSHRNQGAGGGPPAGSSPTGCFISTALYGVDGPITVDLRRWRDQVLLNSLSGRVLVAGYYLVSPAVVLWMSRSSILRNTIKWVVERVHCAVVRFGSK